MTHIIVREYAKLTTRYVEQNSLDYAQISTSAFDWLCQLQGTWSNNALPFVHVDGYRTLKLDNYVGLLQCPCGTRIEILPKTHISQQTPEESRKILCRMLQVVLNLPTREAEKAPLRLMSQSLVEWIIGQFLHTLSYVVKRGLGSQYQVMEEELGCIRGRIHMPRQMRQLPHRQHRIHVCHNVFILNRPENRLLQSALECCRACTKDAENWKLAATLHELMHGIPSSTDICQDFRHWGTGRHMAYYAHIRPWCEIVLGTEIPITMVGQWQGISLLFPMEKLFEAFVAHSLRRQLPHGAILRTQIRKHHLCSHGENKCFQLRPDIVVEYGKKTMVLDTKWKLLGTADKNYGILQADLYQMFAYGHKYQQGTGKLALIYPRADNFSGLQLPFLFAENLALHIWAFDLVEEKILQEDCFSGLF